MRPTPDEGLMNTMYPNKRIILAVSLMWFLLIAISSAIAEDGLINKVKATEARLGSRLGFAMHDYDNGKIWKYRATQRFPISSTFKPILCGAILKKMDEGKEHLERDIPILIESLVSWSPVTKKRVGSTMTLDELCHAAITMSDNSAGNLLLEQIGGPESFTYFMRSLGDSSTHLDRWETELNEGLPGDPRDTTTPDAILKSLHALTIGDVLSENARNKLIEWLKADQVADSLFRASLPEGWKIGDKSGAGGHGSRSIIAIIWPPNRGPVLVALYLTETNAGLAILNKAVAEIGAAIVEELNTVR